MSKVDIAGMIASKTAPAEPDARTAQPVPKNAKRGAASSKKPAVADAATKPSSRPKAAPSKTAPKAEPKWRQCEPQTIYMWPQDIDALKDLARQLQRAKEPGVGERITMATLVRVAVSDLLRNKSHLDGTTEAELLESLSKS